MAKRFRQEFAPPRRSEGPLPGNMVNRKLDNTRKTNVKPSDRGWVDRSSNFHSDDQSQNDSARIRLCCLVNTPLYRSYFADQSQHKARIGSKAKGHAGKNCFVIRALMTIDRTAPQDINQPATFSGHDKIYRAFAI